MSIADDIAGKIPSPKADAEESTANEEMKPGDHGKRILAAINSKNAVALENAIKDCVEDDSTY